MAKLRLRAAAAAGAGRPPPSFEGIETWVFDLDNTLYPASCNLFDQVDRRIGEFVAAFLKLDAAEARRLQKQYFRDYGTTLRGLMTLHAADPARFLDYVHEIDLTPVARNPALDAALARLEGRKIVFTNGSVAHAERVMARLGVERHFHGVCDIVAMDYRPKPDPAAYAALLRRHAVEPRRAVMVEDLARNLAPAAALGMTTVLVRTASEWAEEGIDGDHVHHVVEDLAAWLATVPVRRGAAP